MIDIKFQHSWSWQQPKLLGLDGTSLHPNQHMWTNSSLGKIACSPLLYFIVHRAHVQDLTENTCLPRQLIRYLPNTKWKFTIAIGITDCSQVSLSWKTKPSVWGANAGTYPSKALLLHSWCNHHQRDWTINSTSEPGICHRSSRKATTKNQFHKQFLRSAITSHHRVLPRRQSRVSAWILGVLVVVVPSTWISCASHSSRLGAWSNTGPHYLLPINSGRGIATHGQANKARPSRQVVMTRNMSCIAFMSHLT